MKKKSLENIAPDGLKSAFELLVTKAGGKGTAKVTMVGALLGASFAGVSAKKRERANLEDLVEEYRPEIAERFGLALDQVTKVHVEQAVEELPVLIQAGQALSAGVKTRSLTGVTSAVSGFFAGLGAAALTRRAQTGNAQQNAGNIAGGIASAVGGMMAGRVTRSVLDRNGGEKALEGTAHGYIMEIRDKQLQGVPTTAADIFKVQLAVNPQFDQAIAMETGTRFTNMDAEAQKTLLETEFPDVAQFNDMMAQNINAGARPQGLLFGQVEQVVPLEMEHMTQPPVPQAEPEEILQQNFKQEEAAEKDNGERPEFGPPLPVELKAEGDTKIQLPEEQAMDAELESYIKDVEDRLLVDSQDQARAQRAEAKDDKAAAGFVGQLEQERSRALENAGERAM